MAEHFRWLLINALTIAKRACSDEDIETLVYIFGEYVKNYPTRIFSFAEDNGVVSYGFYQTFLKENRHETKPTPFFKILQIDSKIGWVNPEHLEANIFYAKATKIIKDQKVS